MIISVYKQNSEEKIEKEIDVVLLYDEIECDDCGGTGIFYIHNEDFHTCVVCRGKGKEYVSVY